MNFIHTSVRGFVFASFLLLSVAPLQAARYIIDPAHSSVEFKISHLMVSKVKGRFEKFEGEFSYDEKTPQSWSAKAAIDANSVNTGSADRDKHLRSADFFDVEKFPQITFKSTEITGVEGNKAKLHGLLNMHGVEKPVVLDLEIGGTVQDPWGNARAGFEASGKLNRRDYGIVWNKVLGSGGLVVGEEVDIEIRVEGIADKAMPPAQKDGAGMKKKK